MQEGALYHQGMETGGEHRELSGAGTADPDFKQPGVALQYPRSPALGSNFPQKFLSPTPAHSAVRAEICILFPLIEAQSSRRH